MFKYKNLSEYELDEWLDEFNEIYHEVNSRRDPTDIWLHVVEHAASIHEDLRTANYIGVLNDLPWVFCWLCAFIRNASNSEQLAIRSSLQDIILDKYPGWCFYCQKEVCACQSSFGSRMQTDPSVKRGDEKERRRADARAQHASLKIEHKEPKTLPQFLEMFKNIFGHKNYDVPIEIIAAHFQEEIGEVCENINEIKDAFWLNRDTQITSADLEEEIADVVIWLAALYWKVDYILGGAQRYLSPRRKFKPLKPHELPSLGVGMEELIWRHYVIKTGSRKYMVDPKTQMRPLAPSLSPSSKEIMT